jgi:hypothetical protein
VCCCCTRSQTAALLADLACAPCCPAHRYPPPQIHSFERCALVGNAQRMLLRESGREIDAHDVVLRLNNAPTIGYERFVGSRTTHRLINNQWTREYGVQVRPVALT